MLYRHEIRFSVVLIRYHKPNCVLNAFWIAKFKTNDNSSNKGVLVGDVKFEKVLKIAKKITPVPGGVGPMTIACLMHNTVKAAYINKKNDFINVLDGIL